MSSANLSSWIHPQCPMTMSNVCSPPSIPACVASLRWSERSMSSRTIWSKKRWLGTGCLPVDPLLDRTPAATCGPRLSILLSNRRRACDAATAPSPGSPVTSGIPSASTSTPWTSTKLRQMSPLERGIVYMSVVEGRSHHEISAPFSRSLRPLSRSCRRAWTRLASRRQRSNRTPMRDLKSELESFAERGERRGAGKKPPRARFDMAVPPSHRSPPRGLLVVARRSGSS